jgi:hypothetical protein
VSSEHSWKKDEHGDIDELALEVDDPEGFGGHNGPECTVCGFSECIHCIESQGKDIYNPEQFPCPEEE